MTETPENIKPDELKPPEKMKKERGNKGIGVHAKFARAIGKANDDKVIMWTFKWGWTTERVLMLVLGIKYRPATRLVQKGILRKVETPPKTETAYVLTAPAAERAIELYEDGILGYPYLRSRIPESNLNHEEMSQFLTIFNREFEEDSYLAVREFNNGKKGAVPDFIINKARGDADIREWHETELTPKKGNELYFKIQERFDSFKNGKYDRLVWHFNSPGVLKSYKETMEKDMLPRVIKDRESGKYYVDKNQVGFDPRDLGKVSKFELISTEREKYFEKKKEENAPE